MTNREKKMLGIGALAGAAIGYWLNSDQGRTFRKQTAEGVANTASTAKGFLEGSSQKVKDTASEVIGESQQNLQTISDHARDAIKEVAKAGDQTIQTTEERLALGLRQAQEKINQLSRQLEQQLN